MSGFIESDEHISSDKWDQVQWDKIERNHGHYRANKILSYIPTNGIHLDVGTGNGDGTLLFSQMKETIGVEYGTTSALNAKRKGLEIVLADARMLPFKAGIFESASCLDVLEHIPDPESAIREMERVLSNDGVFILQTPISESFKERLLYFIRKYHIKKQKQPYDIPLKHKEIIRLLEKFRFTILLEKPIRYWAPNPLIHLISISRLFYCRVKKQNNLIKKFRNPHQ
jgi:ubiquinone/menaquinone biosynthesis C-methylase UbiE